MSSATATVPYQSEIQTASSQYGISPSLFAGLIKTESNFNPKATGTNTNGTVDRGITQINSGAHPRVTAAQAYDPYYAIPYSAQLLSNNIKSCGSVTGGLQKYNSGQCSGDTAYSTKVLTAAKGYAGLFPTSGSASTGIMGQITDTIVKYGLIAIVIVFALIFVFEGVK